MYEDEVLLLFHVAFTAGNSAESMVMSEERRFKRLSLSTQGYYFVDLDGLRGFIVAENSQGAGKGDK
jgi:hypothetical protein